MEHLSKVLKILDGAIRHDARRAIDYANLLAEKLERDGEPRQAIAIRTALSKRPVRSFSSAGLRSLPIDEVSQVDTLDIYESVGVEEHLVFNPYVEDQIADFLLGIERFDEWFQRGVAVPNRLLLEGPPGTGKTSLARLLSTRLKLPFATARSDSLVSSLLGQTSRNIREIFEFAQANPCVLFLDEFDALAKMRADSREVGELQRVVIALLQNIDALPASSVVVAATNHPELLDRAVWRRFGYHIRLELPGAVERDRMWRTFLGAHQVVEEKDVTRLVEVSAGMSAAAIESASSDVIRQSVRFDIARPSLPFMMRRIARVVWQDQRLLESDNAEMRALREWQPKVFTVRALADLFVVSTRQVSNALQEAN